MKATRRLLAVLLTCALLLGVSGGAWASELTPEVPADAPELQAEIPAGEEALVPAQAELAEAAGTNLARLEGVTATASAYESTLNGSKAIDGIKSGGEHADGHWSTTNEPNPCPVNLVVDLKRHCTIDSIKLFWKHNSVTAYTLEVSGDRSSWTNVKTQSDRVELEQTVTLSTPATDVRYVRLNVTACDNRGDARWANVNLWEIEIYGEAGELELDASTLLNSLGDNPLVVNADTGKVTFTAEAQAIVDRCAATHTVTFAADYEQLVGPDGTIYQPLVDTTVSLDLTVQNRTDEADKATSDPAEPIQLNIPGKKTANEGNEKPAVIPELMEWYSSPTQSGKTFALTELCRIVAPDALAGVANELKGDIADLFGFTPAVVSDGARMGDIVLVLDEDAAGFDDETYTMEVADKVTITGSHPTGVYWGTRSALQALKMSGDKTIPQGTAKDYPKYRVRGFVLDVGRKPFSMDILYEFAKNMAWYKLNDFHVHLSDNLIWIEDYGYTSNDCTEEQYAAGNAAYGGFRLESSLKEEEGANPLAAKDYHYSKAEFRQFVKDSAEIGVKIVPELDTPAHAKPIVDAFPSLRQPAWFDSHALNDHFNLAEKYDESLAKVKEIYNDYLDGSDPVFTSGVFHFGADEYYPDPTLYRKFHKDMIAFLKEKGQTVRTWGSLSRMASDNPDAQYTKEETAGVQMDIWNTYIWANPTDMYNLGFDLINVTDDPAYMVPDGSGGRGGYGDYLNLGTIYGWAPNVIGGTTFPASSSQILGSAYAIWNDNIDTHASGLDEMDLFIRFFDTLPVISVRQWGEGGDGLDRTLTELQEDVKKTGYAPQTNPEHQVDSILGADAYARYEFTVGGLDESVNHRDLTIPADSTATVDQRQLNIAGGASWAETGMDRLPWNSKLSFWVKVDEPGVLFESDSAYDAYHIRAVDSGNGAQWTLEFERELYDYAFEGALFNYGEWVELTLVSAQQSTVLYVGSEDGGGAAGSREGTAQENAYPAVGYFLSDETSNTHFRGKMGITNSSFSLPVARVGSAEDAFVGAMDSVVISPLEGSAPSPVDSGKYDIDPATYAGATDGNHHSGDDGGKAIDGKADTMWHTEWSAVCPEADGWITIDLGEENEVCGLRYLPRSSGTNGIINTFDVLVSNDNTNWTPAVTDGAFAGSSGWQSVTFDTTSARYVRLLAKETQSDGDWRYVSAVEVRVCRPVDLEADGGTVSFPEDSYPLVGGVAAPDPIVVVDGAALVKDQDYTVTYADNTAKGTATATVTGKGMYTGSISGTFFIGGVQDPPDYSLENAAVTLDEDTFTHTGSAFEPTPTVVVDGATLSVGKDYTVSYSNNVNVGTGSVTVTGVREYSGSKTVNFTINSASGGDVTPPPSGGGTPKPSGGGGGGGGVPSTQPVTTTVTDPKSGAVTEKTVNPDGSTYEKVTQTNGAVTETTVAADGTRTQRVQSATGSVMKTVTEPSGRAIQAMDVPNRGLTITVTDPLGEVDVAVSIPETVPETQSAYVDVPKGHWSEEAVNTVTGLGLFKGDEQGRFMGNSAMTRGMVATVLHRLSGEVSKMPVGFTDVKDGAYYAPALDWAASIQVIQGVGEGKCDPDRAVTRQELAAMLYRYARFIDAEGKEIAHGSIGDFADSGEVSGWATNAMDWAITNGLIQGRGGSLLAPNDPATRAEVAAIFTRLVELIRP